MAGKNEKTSAWNTGSAGGNILQCIRITKRRNVYKKSRHQMCLLCIEVIYA